MYCFLLYLLPSTWGWVQSIADSGGGWGRNSQLRTIGHPLSGSEKLKFPSQLYHVTPAPSPQNIHCPLMGFPKQTISKFEECFLQERRGWAKAGTIE